MPLSREIAIEVAVAMPVHGTFTYRVPEDLARLASPGTRVLVPFGRRRATGYVLGPAPPSDRADIKLIVDVLDERPVFPGAMIPFLRWTADYYKHPLGQVIETALPGGLTVSESAVFSRNGGGPGRHGGCRGERTGAACPGGACRERTAHPRAARATRAGFSRSGGVVSRASRVGFAGGQAAGW